MVELNCLRGFKSMRVEIKQTVRQVSKRHENIFLGSRILCQLIYVKRQTLILSGEEIKLMVLLCV